MIDLINDLKRRLRHVVTRGSLVAAKAGSKLQQVAARVGGVDLPDAEHFEPYGFTSRPSGGEVIVLHVGGDEEHPIIICAADRRYRLTGLQTGDVALYDDQQQAIILGRMGITIRGNQAVGSVKVIGEVGAVPDHRDGVVHGRGLDPYTGQPYYALNSTSSVLTCQKSAGS